MSSIKSEYKVKDVAVPCYVDADLKRNSYEKIQYIEYNSIDKHVGDIANTAKHYENNAPNRAKFRVEKGMVVCARMIDSEKNIAIFPRI